MMALLFGAKAFDTFSRLSIEQNKHDGHTLIVVVVVVVVVVVYLHTVHYTKQLEKVTVARHCNLKAARRRDSRYGLFLTILYCACVQTPISQLPIEILTSPSDSAIEISRRGQ